MLYLTVKIIVQLQRKKCLTYFSCASECRIRDGVNGIHLTGNWLGKLSGIAFIEMEHEEDVRKALEKHRQYLGRRYVEGSSRMCSTLRKAGMQLLTGLFHNNILTCYKTKITGVNDEMSGSWIRVTVRLSWHNRAL